MDPSIYTPAEFAKRVERGDAFVKRVPTQPRIWPIGSDDALVLAGPVRTRQPPA